MKLAKRTYSLPPDLVEKFEHNLPPGERSAFLAKLIADWLALREREALCRQVVEGCLDMAEHYRQVDQEWQSVADEVWRDSSD